MKISIIIKWFISTIVAFNVMCRYLFDAYSAMALAGRGVTYGIDESGMSDAFMYFLEAVVIGIIIWLACMYLMGILGRLFNKRPSEKRRRRANREEGDFRD